ncbi:transposase [Streptomyces sp. NPDC001858]
MDACGGGRARGPYRIQRLLSRIEWDAGEVLNDVRARVRRRTPRRPGAVLIVDDTGFPKKGIRSADVEGQYSGTAALTENSQIGVFLAYATYRGRTLSDRRLYLPMSAHVCPRPGRTPGNDAGGLASTTRSGFETKVVVAKAMVRRTIAELAARFRGACPQPYRRARSKTGLRRNV